MHACRHAYRHVCVGMCVDLCTDICGGMCAGMRVDRSADMQAMIGLFWTNNNNDNNENSNNSNDNAGNDRLALDWVGRNAPVYHVRGALGPTRTRTSRSLPSCLYTRPHGCLCSGLHARLHTHVYTHVYTQVPCGQPRKKEADRCIPWLGGR